MKHKIIGIHDDDNYSSDKDVLQLIGATGEWRDDLHDRRNLPEYKSGTFILDVPLDGKYRSLFFYAVKTEEVQ